MTKNEVIIIIIRLVVTLWTFYYVVKVGFLYFNVIELQINVYFIPMTYYYSVTNGIVLQCRRMLLENVTNLHNIVIVLQHNVNIQSLR